MLLHHLSPAVTQIGSWKVWNSNGYVADSLFSGILVLKFILVLVFISFISNHFIFFYFLSNISISVFISFASNHFYIYFFIVCRIVIFACVSFLCMKTESKTIWFCLMWLSTRMSQHNSVFVVRLTSTRYAIRESLSILLFIFIHSLSTPST